MNLEDLKLPLAKLFPLFLIAKLIDSYVYLLTIKLIWPIINVLFAWYFVAMFWSFKTDALDMQALETANIVTIT